MARDLLKYGELIRQFTVRDVLSRYRGSYLGIVWSMLRPLCMLAVFTVVFGYIFESKFGNRPDETRLDFTLALFCGLIVFDFFGECISRAPTLVVANPNYVTKVIFPLEILPVMVVGAALTQLIISFVPLLVGLICTRGMLPWTIFYLPLILIPPILFCLGFTWFLASLGVFIRDVNSILPVLLQILMYASAIFYSIHKVPLQFQPLVNYNPIATTIEQARNTVLWGGPPDWSQYGWLLIAGGVVMIAGYTFFMRTKNAFADVM